MPGVRVLDYAEVDDPDGAPTEARVSASCASGCLTERSSSCETSTTSIDSGTSPDCLRAVIESPSITRQYGQAVEMTSGLVDSASSTRSVLIRLPIRSSIHIRAPPAPQQKPRSLQRCISVLRRPGTLAMISRGGV